MNKFNSDYEEYLEKNEIYVKKNRYVIWYRNYSTYTGTTIYNPDMTDYYEVSYEKTVAISDSIETDIVFYIRAEAEKYCREHSGEYVECWFVVENGEANEK